MSQVMMILRGGSRAAATSKMEHFVIIVNGFQPLTIITKRSILDVAAALDTNSQNVSNKYRDQDTISAISKTLNKYLREISFWLDANKIALIVAKP